MQWGSGTPSIILHFSQRTMESLRLQAYIFQSINLAVRSWIVTWISNSIGCHSKSLPSLSRIYNNGKVDVNQFWLSSDDDYLLDRRRNWGKSRASAPCAKGIGFHFKCSTTTTTLAFHLFSFLRLLDSLENTPFSVSLKPYPKSLCLLKWRRRKIIRFFFTQ